IAVSYVKTDRVRRLIPALVLGALGVLAAPPRAEAQDNRSEVRDIGDRRELFIDDFLIDTRRGVDLRLHPPTPREVALPLNQPWAGPTTGYTVVMKDGDLYRFYYTNDTDGRTPDCTSYAESKDGITWTLPKLGLFDFKGSRENNLVWVGKGIHN